VGAGEAPAGKDSPTGEGGAAVATLAAEPGPAAGAVRITATATGLCVEYRMAPAIAPVVISAPPKIHGNRSLSMHEF
jgi:hypothetical protein